MYSIKDTMLCLCPYSYYPLLPSKSVAMDSVSMHANGSVNIFMMLHLGGLCFKIAGLLQNLDLKVKYSVK